MHSCGRGLLFTFVFYFTASAFAERIKDNSFLVEEAYNQEAGVVQFINAYQYSDLTKEWNYTFTNELPIHDETHQFSYVLPVLKKAGPPEETEIGDALLNYRYQLINNEHIAVAPRFSLIVPTGDYKKGLGNGAVGFQFNQAVSITVNERWTNHWNAGFTLTPDAKNANDDKATLVGFNFATSVVYDVTEKTNLLCEFSFNNTESIDDSGAKVSSSTYYLAPGIRTAFEVGKDTEIVPGIAALLGFGPSAQNHDVGVFAYLSFESKLW